jgi:hypothetical protein
MKSAWLEPMGMTNSTFQVSDARPSSLARGYRLEDDRLDALEADFVNITPSAGLCTTADDMSRFLVALTANRMPDGARAFAPDTREGLLEAQFASHPGVPGRCYGFNEKSLNGRRVLSQLGSWPGYSSALLVFPRARIGIFLAYNRNDGLQLARALARNFALLLPAGKTRDGNARSAEVAPPDFRSGSRETLAGTYLASRFPTGAPRLGYPREETVVVAADGTISIDGDRFREIDGGVFERLGAAAGGEAGIGRRVAFRYAEAGGVSHLVTEGDTFRRAAWYESGGARRMAAIVVFLIFASAIIWWAVSGVLRFIRISLLGNGDEAGENGRRASVLPSVARAVAAIAAGVGVWMMIIRTKIRIEQDPFAYLYGLPEPVAGLMRMTPWFLLATLLAAGFGVLAWRRKFWCVTARLHFTLLIVAAGAMCLELHHRNLLFP